MREINDIAERLKSLLTQIYSSEVTVTSSGEEVKFEINAGERVEGVGGWCGGTTSGTIKRGELSPRMDSGGGLNPLATSQWYEVMYH